MRQLPGTSHLLLAIRWSSTAEGYRGRDDGLTASREGVARVMPRAFVPCSTPACLAWLTLVATAQHRPWRVAGTTAQRATGGWPPSLIVSERGPVRRVVSHDVWAKWFRHGGLRTPSPRVRLRDHVSQSETGRGRGRSPTGP